jgi:RNA polymerase sigma-70 factor, ECF subfamily
MVESARAGDRAALGEILTAGFPKLVSFYRGMGLPHADAEDLAGEAVAGMVRNLRSLRQVDAFEGWFWTVARNRLRSALRVKGRIAYEPAYAPVDDPAEAAVAGGEYAMIRVALARLSPRDREILWLREVEGLSHDDIARRLALGSGAVRVAALRARRRLEEAYTELHPEDG